MESESDFSDSFRDPSQSFDSVDSEDIGAAASSGHDAVGSMRESSNWARLRIPGAVSVANHVVSLTHPTELGLTAHIALVGARVFSMTLRGRELLFAGKKADYSLGKTPRAGIEVIWPQVGRFGQGVHNGFAQALVWDLVDSGLDYDEDSVWVVLAVSSNAETRNMFPKDFELRLKVELVAPGTLNTELSVKNTGEAGLLSFTGGIQANVRAEDITEASIRGLTHTEFVDQRKDRQESSYMKRNAAVLTISEEIDRIYQHAPGTVRIELPTAFPSSAASTSSTSSSFSTSSASSLVPRTRPVSALFDHAEDIVDDDDDDDDNDADDNDNDNGGDGNHDGKNSAHNNNNRNRNRNVPGADASSSSDESERSVKRMPNHETARQPQPPPSQQQQAGGMQSRVPMPPITPKQPHAPARPAAPRSGGASRPIPRASVPQPPTSSSHQPQPHVPSAPAPPKNQPSLQQQLQQASATAASEGPTGKKKLVTMLVLQQRQFSDFGIWNPWTTYKKPDFDKDDYKHVLGLLSCHAFSPISLGKGAVWTGKQTLMFELNQS